MHAYNLANAEIGDQNAPGILAGRIAIENGHRARIVIENAVVTLDTQRRDHARVGVNQQRANHVFAGQAAGIGNHQRQATVQNACRQAEGCQDRPVATGQQIARAGDSVNFDHRRQGKVRDKYAPVRQHDNSRRLAQCGPLRGIVVVGKNDAISGQRIDPVNVAIAKVRDDQIAVGFSGNAAWIVEVGPFPDRV